MRAVFIAVGGLLVAFGLNAMSSVMNGLPGAALFVLALAAVPVSLGVAVANVSAGSIRTANSDRCGECGRSRRLRGDVWVCEDCDFGSVALKIR